MHHDHGYTTSPTRAFAWFNPQPPDKPWPRGGAELDKSIGWGDKTESHRGFSSLPSWQLHYPQERPIRMMILKPNANRQWPLFSTVFVASVKNISSTFRRSYIPRTTLPEQYIIYS